MVAWNGLGECARLTWSLVWVDRWDHAQQEAAGGGRCLGEFARFEEGRAELVQTLQELDAQQTGGEILLTDAEGRCVFGPYRVRSAPTHRLAGALSA
jgi:hypothetical protein